MEMIVAFVFLGALLLVAILALIVNGQRGDAAWRRLAAELGAEFIKGGFFRSSQVQVHIKDSTVTLDKYTLPSGDSYSTYTRMRTLLQNKDGYQFAISRTGLISKLDKALGAQDIDIGDPDFDRDFVVQGNNISRVQALLANQKIRQLIQAQRSIHLRLKDNELTFEAQGHIKDVERLKALFDLFKEMLNQLEGDLPH